MMSLRKLRYNKAGLGISLPNIEKVENSVIDPALSFSLSYIPNFRSDIIYHLSYPNKPLYLLTTTPVMI
jgi:hypothetical protein